MASTESTGIQRAEWRVILLASLGGALEFYDFVVYSTFAQYIGAAFFPSDDPLASLTRSFAVFAVGYFARPIGGIVFSHFGDKIGRRRVMIIAILVMSAATVCMGLLPTYATWGVKASILMVVLRMIQGFCLGGELPGAITYVVETAPKRAGFSVGIIFFCVNSGVALAALLSLALHSWLTTEQVADFGWRIGFLVGGVLGLVSFWLRLSLEESKEFAKVRSVAGAASIPLLEVLRTQPGRIFVGIAILSVTAGFNGLLFGMPAFLPRVMDYSALAAIQAQNLGLAVLSVGLLTIAWLCDFVSRTWLLRIGSLLLLLFSLAFFNAAEDRSVHLLILFVLAGLVASFCNGTVCAIAADLFPTRIRFSGVALIFNLAFTIFSGIAPLVATYLVSTTGSPSSAAYYMMGCALLALIGTVFLKRYDGRILGELRERAAV